MGKYYLKYFFRFDQIYLVIDVFVPKTLFLVFRVDFCIDGNIDGSCPVAVETIFIKKGEALCVVNLH